MSRTHITHKHIIVRTFRYASYIPLTKWFELLSVYSCDLQTIWADIYVNVCSCVSNVHVVDGNAVVLFTILIGFHNFLVSSDWFDRIIGKYTFLDGIVFAVYRQIIDYMPFLIYKTHCITRASQRMANL